MSPYSIELDVISDNYSDGFYSFECGLIAEYFHNLKKELYYCMFDVDEIIESYEAVIHNTDPRKFITEFENTLSCKYPFERAGYRRAGNILNSIDSLNSALNEIDVLRTKLEDKKLLNWARNINETVGGIKNEVIKFISDIDKDEFMLYWILSKDGKIYFYAEEPSKYEGAMIQSKHKREISYENHFREKKYVKLMWMTF